MPETEKCLSQKNETYIIMADKGVRDKKMDSCSPSFLLYSPDLRRNMKNVIR